MKGPQASSLPPLLLTKKQTSWKERREREKKGAILLLGSYLLYPQVSVERLFSALEIIISDARTRFKADLVEAILFLRKILKIFNVVFEKSSEPR